MRSKTFIILACGVLLLSIIWIITQRETVINLIKVDDPNIEIPFDKTKWQTKEGTKYIYRNAMLNNLVRDSEIRKLKRTEILSLLGQPTKVNGNYQYYRVDEKKAILLTLHTKTLVIHFNPDDTIDWMKIHQ